jgi:hypothetical protein
MRHLRVIAIIGLMLYSIVVAATNGLAAHARWTRDSQTSDSVSKWEKRVKPVLDHIPSTVTELGYVADWDIPDSGYDIIDQDNEYTLTQYALAPRIVQPGLDHEWIIGNFTNTGFRNWLDKNISSYKLIQIGFGIYVIHRTSP